MIATAPFQDQAIAPGGEMLLSRNAHTKLGRGSLHASSKRVIVERPGADAANDDVDKPYDRMGAESALIHELVGSYGPTFTAVFRINCDQVIAQALKGLDHAPPQPWRPDDPPDDDRTCRHCLGPLRAACRPALRKHLQAIFPVTGSVARIAPPHLNQTLLV